MGVVGIVQATAQQAVVQEEHMGGFLEGCYQLIHKVHRVWRWYRRAELYSNPDNFLSLAAGHGLNWLGGGNSSVINIAAQVLLVASRIITCVEAQIEVVREARALWVDAVNPYYLPPRVEWKDEAVNSRWISPSDRIEWKKMWGALMERIKRVAYRLFSLGKKLFLLSMKTLDAAEAFSYNNNSSERINELFVNSRKCLSLLADNQELLLHGLQKNKGVIASLLGNTHSVFTADQFIDVVANSFKAVKAVNEGVETVSQAVGDIGRDIAKHMVFGLFQAAGLLDLLPNSWVPEQDPFGVEEAEEIDVPRFLPLEETRVSMGDSQPVENKLNIEVCEIVTLEKGWEVEDEWPGKEIEVKFKKRYDEICIS